MACIRSAETGVALTGRIDFELPATAPPDAETFVQVPPIRLRIAAAGQACWNDNAAPLSALQAMLTAEAELDPRHPPHLEIDTSGESEDQTVSRVLAAAHNANVVRVGASGIRPASRARRLAEDRPLNPRRRRGRGIVAPFS